MGAPGDSDGTYDPPSKEEIRRNNQKYLGTQPSASTEFEKVADRAKTRIATLRSRSSAGADMLKDTAEIFDDALYALDLAVRQRDEAQSKIVTLTIAVNAAEDARTEAVNETVREIVEWMRSPPNTTAVPAWWNHAGDVADAIENGEFRK